MASLSPPATTEQMIQEELKQRDRMMTQSIQALAMDRLRSSVRSLSRETGFQSRPAVEQFSQAPLYIPNPEYMKWSNTLGKLVSTGPMKQYSTLEEAAFGGEFPLRPVPLEYMGLMLTGERRRAHQLYHIPSGSSRRLGTILNNINLRLRREWEAAQRMLPR